MNKIQVITVEAVAAGYNTASSMASFLGVTHRAAANRLWSAARAGHLRCRPRRIGVKERVFDLPDVEPAVEAGHEYPVPSLSA